YSTPNWAQQDVFSGGYTNNITVENTGNQSIFGGTAENTVIKDKGIATLKNQGIFKDGKVYKGGFFIAQSGTVDNINVYENGRFDISGNDDSVIVEGGEITHGATGVFMGKARINNLKISGDVAAASRDNPHFSHAYIGQLGQLILSSGKITESTIEGGLLSVVQSEASDTTMKGGSIEVGEGGIFKRTQMTGGSLNIKDGGRAEATVVNGGGRMLNDSGTDIGTVVNSGTYTLGDAHSTTAQSNNLTLGNEATAYIRKGTVNGANLGNGQMILGFERLSSTLKGDVTVGERGQLNVINNGELDTREANLNLSGRVNLDNDPDPGKVSKFGKVSMNQGHFYFDYSISGGFSKNYSILFLETLSGTGTFWMNTDIAEHRGDFLLVRGEANGYFGIRVTDSGKSPKAEDRLKIIQTGGGDADFELTNPGQVVDVGTYQYHLVPDEHKRGWSLVSHQPQPAEKPQPESESPPKASVIPSVTETVAASRPISGDTLFPQETEHSVQPGILAPKAPEPKPEAPVAPSVPEEKEAVLTPVSGETVAPTVTDETQTGKLAPKAPELKPEAPVAPSVEKEGEKKVATNRLLSPPKNVSRTNRA
ncbi:pertactin-like passenger domain-containing protein, partial [Candidatus Williamhamiltonella defendens]|uniref:pertactin-like passenger domain-containing protein n=1 Tax=Candidatus Williamhamiltonella defendens TaxID=138072 RepID=UPI0015838E14